ncbi:STAS domain-containing protein, partial [Streptomyces parvus]
MFLLSYQLDAAHLVVELGEVIDLDNESAIEREIVRLLPCCGPRAVIVDIRTPLLTPRALGVLLRVRGQAEERGVSVAVVAGYDKAREVLGAAGLHRVLRVAATLPGA